jgi:hypothetical protein
VQTINLAIMLKIIAIFNRRLAVLYKAAIRVGASEKGSNSEIIIE